MAEAETEAAPADGENECGPTTSAAELVTAIREGAFARALEVLAGRGDQVDALTENGESPLVACACDGREQLLSRMLAAGATPSAQTASGLTALAGAAMSGHLGCVNKLLQAGAPVDAVGGSSRSTALILAARNGHRACCEALLEAGADVEVVDAYGDTAEAAAHRFEVEGRLYASDFSLWQSRVEDRAAAIAAEPAAAPPLYPLDPMGDLTRWYRSTEPTKMLWRPGAWVHQKRPATGAVATQERPRAFSATGFAVQAPPVPMEDSVLPAERLATTGELRSLQHDTADARTISGHTARERTLRNPQVFADDVPPTLTSTRATVMDATSAFAAIAKQEARLYDAYGDDVPTSVAGAPVYSSGLQRAAMATPTAAATLYPMLEPPPAESLSSLLKPKPKVAEAPAAEPDPEPEAAGKGKKK